jgi:hypothetical protein
MWCAARAAAIRTWSKIAHIGVIAGRAAWCRRRGLTTPGGKWIEATPLHRTCFLTPRAARLICLVMYQTGLFSR